MIEPVDCFVLQEKWETNLKILKVNTRDPRLKISCYLLVFYCCIFLFFVCLFIFSKGIPFVQLYFVARAFAEKYGCLRLRRSCYSGRRLTHFFLALTVLNDAFTILTVIADSFVIRRYSDDKVVSFIKIKKYIWQLPTPLCHALFRWILNNCLW